jgi:hypothetical protein
VTRGVTASQDNTTHAGRLDDFTQHYTNGLPEGITARLNSWR